MISVSVQFHKDGILSCNYLIIYVLWYMYIASKCSFPTLLICTWKIYMSCYQKPIIKNIDMTYAFIITPTIWCDKKWNGKSWHGIYKRMCTKSHLDRKRSVHNLMTNANPQPTWIEYSDVCANKNFHVKVRWLSPKQYILKYLHFNKFL